MRFLQGFGGFRRHVVFVVFGEHFLRDEHAFRVQASLRNHAFAFGEQVGQDAFELDGDIFDGIGDDKTQGHAVCLTRERTGGDQPADAKELVLRRLADLDIGRGIEKRHVFLQGGNHEKGNQTERSQRAGNQEQTLMAGFHAASPLCLASARSWRVSRCTMRRC